ncbi:hypothetical protein EJ08DRAFT_117595 [Tothia fuscella]|uniref:Uncharacterized protein n=1 Tax=Tothia fuscella TaxID=1048955 RepID=A0A9P4NV45_9PEZI|nr:hypothetical protein EJ08DRAFT_117595 [Tothia fuscella]
MKSRCNKSKEIVILPALAPLSSKRFETDQDARFFGLFISHCVPQSNRLVDSTLWSQTVLQIAHEELAVKHGLLALGALHANSDICKRQHPAALRNYSKALSEAQQLVRGVHVDEDSTKVLVCALLFHCIETILGCHAAAKAHLSGDLKLLYEKKLLGGDLNDNIASAYRRFDFGAMTFWDHSAPYELDPRVTTRLKSIQLPESFSTLNHATNTLIELFYSMFVIEELHFNKDQLCPSGLTTYIAELN